jgi:hypothetical protein
MVLHLQPLIEWDIQQEVKKTSPVGPTQNRKSRWEQGSSGAFSRETDHFSDVSSAPICLQGDSRGGPLERLSEEAVVCNGFQKQNKKFDGTCLLPAENFIRIIYLIY